MNVDGVVAFFLDFILAETRRKICASFCWQQHADIEMILITNLGRCLTHVSHCHVFKKNDKNVTEQMTSNKVLAQIFLALWTLNPGATSSYSTVWIHAVRACIRKHNILQFIY